MSRGIHTKPIRGLTNEWLTPPHIVHALGQFDLDPACPEFMPWRTADAMWSKEGLDREWFGRVWLNPPYGNEIGKWLAKLVMHGNGIALVPARTEVESWFWPHVWEGANAVLFLRGRLYFHRPDGSLAGNAGHGSVLAAYGKTNAGTLKTCGIDGRFFRL